MASTSTLEALPRLLLMCIWMGAFSLRQKGTMAFLSPHPMIESPRIPRIHPLNQLGNMWLNEYDDYEEVDDYYHTELRSPKLVEDRPVVRMSAPIVPQAIPDSSLDDYYSLDDDDSLDMEEEEASTAPGNFWINSSPDRTEEERRRRRRSTAQPPPLRKSSVRSGADPKPPPPLLDFYNRLFWYGLDPSDDVSGEYENEADSEKRTMFGGTKGKFNGLSFLSDAVGVVPPEKQRPYRRSRRRDDLFSEDSEDNDAVVDLEEDRIPYAKDATQRRRVPVTPPYDPPRVPVMNGEPANEASPRWKQTTRQPSPEGLYNANGESLYDSWDDSTESPYDYEDRRPAPDDARSRNGRERSSRRGRSRGGDWVTTTVSSWFDSPEEDFTRGSVVDSSRLPSTSPRRRSRTKDVPENDRNGSFQYPPVLQTFTGALETFMGADREEQQQQAAEYDARMGFSNRRTRNRARTAPPEPPELVFERQRSSRRPNVSQPWRTTVLEPKNTPEETLNVLDEVDGWGQTASKMKPLTWEERALAIERVPPAGMTAWGPEGAIHNMDARTKALQDAIVDVNLIQNKIKKYEQSILDLQDEMSILKIDIELERRKLHNQHLDQAARNERRSRSTSNQRLLERIRSMELEFENMSRKLRYLQLRKSRAEQESLDLNRRHWALFHCMKQILAQDTLSKQMEDILQEFNAAEPAARLYVKTGESLDATSAPPAAVPMDDDPLVSSSSSSSEYERTTSND
jgi:hypothetical protein